MAEFWGWCATCARWFYAAASAVGDCQPSNMACPVCMAPPELVEVRHPDASATA